MKIAYDYQAFGQPFGGIPRYFTAVADHLAQQDDIEIKFFAGLHSNHFLREHKSAAVDGCYFPWLRRPSLRKLKLQANRVWSRQSLTRFAPDILHETYFYPESILSDTVGARRVVTVFDMISDQFFHEQDREYRMAAKKAAVQRADHVICISEHTRKDLLKRVPLDESKVSVAHLGFSTFPEKDEGEIPAAYILYVGARAGYKNFVRFLTAYASSRELMNNFQLVCVGGGGDADIQELTRDLCIPEGWVLHRRVSDAELGTLYRHAAAFVYPSLYEGFGIPLLEAMSCNCPVVCASASCFPEVAGDAAEYFDPMSVESIQNAICNVVFNTERSAVLQAAGTERVKKFSWERCAEQHLEVYRALM